jgi:hypothetical protein
MGQFAPQKLHDSLAELPPFNYYLLFATTLDSLRGRIQLFPDTTCCHKTPVSTFHTIQSTKKTESAQCASAVSVRSNPLTPRRRALALRCICNTTSATSRKIRRPPDIDTMDSGIFCPYLTALSASSAERSSPMRLEMILTTQQFGTMQHPSRHSHITNPSTTSLHLQHERPLACLTLATGYLISER